MDDERLRNPPGPGAPVPDYFDELLERVRVIQNKLHFASTGKTTTELIRSRADAKLPNMGLTSWKGDEVRKSDVTIAYFLLERNQPDQIKAVRFIRFDDQVEITVRTRVTPGSAIIAPPPAQGRRRKSWCGPAAPDWEPQADPAPRAPTAVTTRRGDAPEPPDSTATGAPPCSTD